MNELIKVNYKNEQVTISARELYEFIGIEERFSKWWERMVSYGFINSIDYTPYQMVHPQNKQHIDDYQLTLDMAKEIAMLQRNEKGKEARKYFIQLEKEWNSPEKVMARALKIANHTIENLKIEVKEMKPKAIFADAVASSHTSILVGDLAKLLKQNGIEIGQNRLFDWLRENGYLMKSGVSRNMPTQKSMSMGLFEVKERTILNPDGSVRITKTTKVTGKGQQYFVNKFLGS